MNEHTAESVKGPGRRHLLTAGVATAAALAGAGAAWWKFRTTEPASGAIDNLWQLSFTTPSGGQLAMASLRGKPLVLNFWATWCPPCVEEMPMLDAFAQQHAGKGWQVVGLAIDQPSAVRQFLARTPVHYAIGLAGLEGTDLVRALGNTNGGLPFTVVVRADGTVRQRRMGKLSRTDLDTWITG